MTFTAFKDGLQDMTVVGVNRVYGGPPRSIPASELPAMWIELPNGSDRPITADGEGGWPMFNADVWVAVQAVEQGTQVENYDATCTVMDNLMDALMALPVGGTTGALCKSKLNWTIRGDYLDIGQTRYWTVIASVTGHG